MIWVPGVAFDSTGGRLGRGKAYYDVLLSRLAATTIRTGIAFDWQIVDEPLPRENWDQTLDEVLTDQRLLRARR